MVVEMLSSAPPAGESADDARWAAVVARTPAPDGLAPFLLGVTSTGIYCRPGCPARTPLRRNVRFFDTADDAEAAGLRACLRCRPRAAGPVSDPDGDAAERVLAACRALDDAGGPLPPEHLAAVTGWSTRQLHRRFTEVTGTTPRAYGEALRAQRLRPALRSTQHDDTTLLDAAFATGYGSVRAFYEQGAARLGMTASSYAAGGRGERLLWSVGAVDVEPARLPLQVLVVASLTGVVAVRLGDDVDVLLAEVTAELPGACLAREDDVLADVVAAVTALARGVPGAEELPLDVRGTAFQATVWAALRRIPAGQTRSYSEVAVEVGRPGAVRAVASACARNPVAVVTPCHRVVRSDGGLGGFRWGLEVKEALLRAEQG